jgi:hypothetical protein
MTPSPLLLAAALAGLAAPAAADVPMWFRTPSDNIHCMIANGEGVLFLDCEIREREAGALLGPRPADCELDWGNRFVLGEWGPGRMACAGDTVVYPGSPVIAYGETVQFGPFTCSSTQDGLDCRNVDGHGIFLSRARQEVY